MNLPLGSTIGKIETRGRKTVYTDSERQVPKSHSFGGQAALRQATQADDRRLATVLRKETWSNCQNGAPASRNRQSLPYQPAPSTGESGQGVNTLPEGKSSRAQRR